MVSTDRPPVATLEARTGRHVPPAGLWARWSLRDLRQRWLQVAAIAVVIALGTGTYAGLTASAQWRRASYDASYADTNAHDVLITLAEGTTVDGAALRQAIQEVPDPDLIGGVTTSLTVSVQVDASTDDEVVLVPGELFGVEVVGDPEVDGDPVPPIDTLAITGGRGLTAADAGQDVVVLDANFANAHDLGPTGTLELSGGRPVPWIGTGTSPRAFYVSAESGTIGGARGYAILYTSLARAQAEADAPGQVSSAALAVAPGADPVAVRDQVTAALAEHLPGAAPEVRLLEEERGYRTLYDDIDNDTRVFRVFALLILAGAAFAAFNLTGRIVEAQRREIGIGMALGVPQRWLGLRPLLLAAEIAVLGVAVGLVVGRVVGAATGDVTEAFFVLPAWQRPFQLGPYLQASALGIGLVVAASVWPVARAVRVPPVEAVRTGPRTTARGASRGWRRHLHLPGSTIATLPLRGVARRPRRTALTVLGIAAVIATLVGLFGMIDSIFRTIDDAETEVLRTNPDRLSVTLQGFVPDTAPVVDAVASAPGVGQASTGLRIGGTLATTDTDLEGADPLSSPSRPGDRDRFDVLIEVVDLTDGVWAPTAAEGSLTLTEPSLVLARSAADDLGVGVGDLVRLRHPVREGLGYRWVTSDLPVGAIHPNPYRFETYLDVRHADLLQLEGVVNVVDVAPAPGADLTQLRRALFETEGVGSVVPVREQIEVIRTTLEELLGILEVIAWAVLLLAVLIAFNSSSIAADERAREHATMFAFGLPTRTVLLLSMAESALVGAMATVLGAIGGTGLTWWLVTRLFADTLPDIALVVDVEPATFALAAALGIVAVGLAPALTLRRLRRMDIPATLRVVE